MKLGWKNKQNPRYVVDITGTNLLCLEELGGGNSEKSEKRVILNLRRSDQILMKCDVWKDIVSQSSYFKS